MSWSISKLYRNPQEAHQKVEGEVLPLSVKSYIETACVELAQREQYADAPVLVHGHGHLMSRGPGGGDYAVTTAKLVVLSMPFDTLLSLPLQVV